MALAKTPRGELFYEEKGDGLPILLIHPAGGTASTWGAVADDLARVGRVIAYDRRGYARSGGEPAHSIPAHTADAAAILDTLGATPAVMVGTSVGATIAIDLALRRPDAVRTVIAHESPWRARRHPSASALKTLVQMWWLARRGRHAAAVAMFLCWAYTYRDGGSAWDVFPETWRRAAQENAKATLADIWIAIGDYPHLRDLARVQTPVVCTYGARSVAGMARLTRALARAIPTATVREIAGAGHAVAFDAPGAFVEAIAEGVRA
jgi:pimeloyl-ACP methyl ester carboxylesterase